MTGQGRHGLGKVILAECASLCLRNCSESRWSGSSWNLENGAKQKTKTLLR